MRVLVVAHTFPPASETGSEIYARDLAVAVRRRSGAEVLVLAREADADRKDYSTRTESGHGLTIVWINNTFRSVRGFEDSYKNPRLGAAAAQVIDDFAPDVAHIHHLTCLSTAIPAALAARAIPIVLTLHDYWLMCHRGQLLDRNYRLCDGPGGAGCGACLGPEARAGAVTSAAGGLARGIARRVAPLVPLGRVAPEQERQRTIHMREVCAHVSRFVAPSRAMRDRFIAFGVAADRITLSPYGFDRAPFQRMPRNPSDRLRLGFLGSVMASKAPHILLDAASRLSLGSVSVDLFGAYAPYHGDDSYRTRMDSLLAAADARAHGAIPHAQVPAALAAIDVLVVPSIWPENSPLVIREAFLAGVPVVASRIGGIVEAVQEGRNGLLFEPGDAGDLARVLTRLRTERGLLDSLRAGAASTTVRSLDDDADRTFAMYESLTARPKRRARLAAVVLNYRTPDDTYLAVSSLRASRRPVDELIVVDNGSCDTPIAALHRAWPPVTYLRTARNLGYSGGVNIGIREALRRGADRVLLVNSDVIVPPDCAERLERALDGTPGAGIAGPIVLGRSDPDLIGSLGMSYRPASGRMRHRAYGLHADALALPPAQPVDGVSGCLMLVTRDVFEAIGLLDEDYFFSFEDLDFCLRARRAGFSTVLAGLASVHHEGGRSIGAQSPRRLYFAARGHLMLARRAGPPAGAFASALRTASIVALNVAHAVRSSGAPLPVRLAAVARGTLDYFNGRVGADSDASA